MAGTPSGKSSGARHRSPQVVDGRKAVAHHTGRGLVASIRVCSEDREHRIVVGLPLADVVIQLQVDLVVLPGVPQGRPHGKHLVQAVRPRPRRLRTSELRSSPRARREEPQAPASAPIHSARAGRASGSEARRSEPLPQPAKTATKAAAPIGEPAAGEAPVTKRRIQQARPSAHPTALPTPASEPCRTSRQRGGPADQERSKRRDQPEGLHGNEPKGDDKIDQE